MSRAGGSGPLACAFERVILPITLPLTPLCFSTAINEIFPPLGSSTSQQVCDRGTRSSWTEISEVSISFFTLLLLAICHNSGKSNTNPTSISKLSTNKFYHKAHTASQGNNCGLSCQAPPESRARPETQPD